MVYKIYIMAAGATPVVAKENNERAEVDSILGSVTPRTKIVFLANPNNPTGTYLPFEEVRRLHAGSAEKRIAGAGCRLCGICAPQ